MQLASAAGLWSVVGEYLPHFLTAIIIALAVSAGVFWRGWREWRRAQFGSRINLSLNLVTGNALRIRTLMEADVRDVVLSPYARRLIAVAAKKTTREDPILHFASTDDAWMVYNEILNAISELYGPYFLLLAAASGGDVRERQFHMAITWERDAEVRIQKLRVLIADGDTLKLVASDKDGSIKVEVANQAPRLRTLTRMHAELSEHGWPRHQSIALPVA